jgi:transposase InsO family protein
VERLSARERERVAELVAEGAPFWRLLQEVPRSRYAINRAVKRLNRPPAREPIRSPLRWRPPRRRQRGRGSSLASTRRFHRTVREEFLTGKTFDSVEDAQAQLDGWVEHYNHQRPHQGIGMVPPFERFRLAQAGPATIELEGAAPDTTEQPPSARRRVSSNGRISFASTYYLAGVCGR